MSQEHHREHHERHEAANQELEAARRERLEQLRQDPERHENAEQRAEAAREVINRHEADPEPEPEPTPEPAAPKIKVPFIDHELNYAETLASVQRRLSPVSRTFSKVIHAPVVERASEALEKSIARPSVSAGTTWTALIVGGVFYFTARNFGYELSGSELLFSFVVGALLGVLFEGLWRAFARR
jgi:hypothetical protein